LSSFCEDACVSPFDAVASDIQRQSSRRERSVSIGPFARSSMRPRTRRLFDTFEVIERSPVRAARACVRARLQASMRHAEHVQRLYAEAGGTAKINRVCTSAGAFAALQTTSPVNEGLAFGTSARTGCGASAPPRLSASINSTSWSNLRLLLDGFPHSWPHHKIRAENRPAPGVLE
jgi:hypothetical protein